MRITQALLLSSLMFLNACGSNSDPETLIDDDTGSNNNGSETSPEIVEINVDFVDSFWLPGGRTYVSYQDSLAISHNAGVSLLNISSSGLVETEVQITASLANNLAALTNDLLGILGLNSVSIQSLEGSLLDAVYSTQPSPNLSATIFASYGNCVYWVDRGTSGESPDTLEELCISEESGSTEVERYQTSNYIDNIFPLQSGEFVVFEGVSGNRYIKLFNSEFELKDEYSSTEEIYGSDIEYRDGFIFFTGFSSVWKMSVDSNGLGEPVIFQEPASPSVVNAINRVSVHNEGVFIANSNFIYFYRLSNDEIQNTYKIDVVDTVEGVFVYQDFLIVSHENNVGIKIYKISDF
ncbi:MULTISPECIES: hypothetical protein [unclassified Alteromonas]|uniref:hypothetical protein n=1 Tax=unclassified Alteromonas TaxID=2614992 RepID=UPI0005095D88|nr:MULTISPECIES: hypothetical protein [unclassified Alteromonas]